MWQLIKVQHTNWIQDESGYYALINWIDENTVRLDWMDKDNMPVVSYQGRAADVCKAIMQSEDRCNVHIRRYEHASYIGAELARAELLGSEYVQD